MSSMSQKKNRQGRLRLFAAAVLFLVVVAAGLHLYAVSLDGKARSFKYPVATRATAASLAARIEPWNTRFAVTRSVVEAQDLLGKGRVDDAYFLLLPLSRTVRGDDLFRQTYQQVVAQKWVLDSRKAHVQHGREKKGGALDPDDVLK